jgi:amino acid transporter
MVVINNPTYVLEPVHISALCVGSTVVCTLFGIFGARLLAKANTFNLILNLAGVVAISITLLVKTENYKTSEQVFTEITNVSGWSGDFIPWVAALGQAALSTTAYDSIAHFSTEMKNPQRSLPIAMVSGVGLNGIVGFLYVIVLGYVVPNDLTPLVESATGFPFAQLLLDTTGSVAGTTVLLLLLLLPFFCTVADVNMASARILLGFAERGGLPKVMAGSSAALDCPTWATALVCVIQIGLAWTLCGSTAAFASFVSAPALCRELLLSPCA